jgi:DNA-binding CsgD family transcriptional regulator/tetratricopeptide (TPR) repeat protein
MVCIEGEAGIGKTSLVLSFTEAHRLDARVYAGACECLSTPEALGPLRDVARDSRGLFAVLPSSPLDTFESLLMLLKGGRAPALLVIEDIQWADDATLDLIAYLGRRVRTLPVMVVVTLRHDEVPRPQLASLWTDLPRDFCERVDLRPLSLAAVSVLAVAAHRNAREVFDATAGNPFYVTEYLATKDDSVPRTVHDATLARAARLSPRARRTLDCAAIFPLRINEEILCSLADDSNHSGAEECLSSGMLNARGGMLAFRHELARRAVLDALSPLHRRNLHGAALELLRSRAQGRAAEIAHHAEQAGAVEDLVAFSVLAADEAAALGAQREAVAHLDRALTHGVWLADADRASLLEGQATAGEHCGMFDVAAAAIERAIQERQRTGDVLGLGNALRIAARILWMQGHPTRAEQYSDQALEVMREHTETWQYAMALSGHSQLDMLADRNTAAIERGTEAMARARRLGCWDIYIHALTNVATARCWMDAEEGLQHMTAGIAEARRLNQLDALPRLYSCLVYVMVHSRCYDGLAERFQEGIAAAAARDNAPLEAYIRGSYAIAQLDRGRIREAIEEARGVVDGPYSHGISRFTALIALSRGRVRTGHAEGGILDQARALPAANRDIMRMAPIAVVDAEAVWLGIERPGAVERLRAAFDAVLPTQGETWALADTALWLIILGERVVVPPEAMRRLSPAHRLHVTGDWRGAAEAWRKLGCPYEQAIALAQGTETEQREALALFDGMGAAPAAQRLRRLMRQRGIRSVPTGPRSARRANPAGLTPRQSQVLAELGSGRSNAEIAHRLRMSVKTVEHHVGAVLATLNAPSRLRAVQIARERGLIETTEN